MLAGIALALFGLAPRQAALSWAALAACVLLVEVGPLLSLDQAIMDVSPSAHVPKLPGAAMTAAPAWLAALAGALAAAGLAGFRRRDLG